MSLLLTREQFKAVVFERDKYKCVVCGADAVDAAHHIIDRALWDDGGYYADNGVSLCAECHLRAEKTLISCQELREAAGIEAVMLPEHFYADQSYDHWGNIISGGAFIKGELFHEPQVQKILKEAGVLDRFTPYVKYPRTYHLSFSENLQNDDRRHPDESFFQGKQVVVTEKLDGENTSLYQDYTHARSVFSKHHPSRSTIKAIQAGIASEIPPGYRVCGENMYAKHSIHYKNLKSLFYVYSIWDETNTALSWDETVEWCQLLDLEAVPLIYKGPWNKDTVVGAYEEYCSKTKDEVEGFVLRIPARISYHGFRMKFAKFVRKGHVTTSTHWMSQKIVRNEIIS